jgi:hypothetical protein
MPNPFPRLPKSDRGYRVTGPVVLLIGSREMPVQCADLLRAGGFDIAGIHSPDTPLREFAAQHDIEYFPHFADFRDWSETIAHDYLFSILNFKILPASMLDAPNMRHPLPRCALPEVRRVARLRVGTREPRDDARHQLARHDARSGRRGHPETSHLSDRSR